MIRVTVTKQNESILQIEVSGHAFSNDPGFDLVCAGVSSIATGALNGFDQLDGEYELIMLDDPYIKIACKKVNEENQLLMRFVLAQLETVAYVHGEHIKIKVKEEIR